MQDGVVAPARNTVPVNRREQLLHQVPVQRARRQLAPIGARGIDQVEALLDQAVIVAIAQECPQVSHDVLHALPLDLVALG